MDGKSSKFAFVGGSYLGQSSAPDGEQAIDIYPERIDSGNKKSSSGPGDVFVLYRRPGLRLHCTLPDSPIRGLWGGEGRLFAVAGQTLFEVFRDGTYTALGTVGDPNNTPVQMVANGGILFVVASGLGYVANGIDVQPATYVDGTTPLTAVTATFIDGYFVSNQPFSKNFNLSAINASDAHAWDPLDVAAKEGGTDILVAVLANAEALWLFGSKTIEVWYDSGAANFPFTRIQGAFIEQGCASSWTPVKLDNSIFWLGADDRGNGIVWKATGYTPTRVSNHAVEQEWQSYPAISDAVAYGYQENGHSFYVITFPSAHNGKGATWVFDASTGFWHRRGWWDIHLGAYWCFRGRYHAFAFGGPEFAGIGGMHIVGDWQSGKLYQQSTEYYDDAGDAIRWLRSSPHIAAEMKWMFFSELRIDMQVGGQPSSPLLDGLGNPRPAQVMLRISNDGGNTWGDELVASAGSVGQYKTRVRWRNTGRSRDRCYEVSGTDPIPLCIVDAYSDIYPGNGS